MFISVVNPIISLIYSNDIRHNSYHDISYIISMAEIKDWSHHELTQDLLFYQFYKPSIAIEGILWKPWIHVTTL